MRCMPGKAYIAVSGPSKASLVGVWKEKRKAVERASVFLENTSVVVNRMSLTI